MVKEIAKRTEDFGYASIWTNDTTTGNGFLTAIHMGRSTRSATVGIGAVACDRWSVSRIAERLNEADLPQDRLVLVIGAGRAVRPLQAVESAVSELRRLFPGSVRLGVAALGPAMCRLAGRIADLVLLNWVTPQRILQSRKWIAEGAEAGERSWPSGRAAPEVVSYVRVALGPEAAALLGAEYEGYRHLPHYRRHFGAMGEVPGIAAPAQADLPGLLEPYEKALDQTVVRAVPTSNRLEDYLEIVAAGRPKVEDQWR